MVDSTQNNTASSTITPSVSPYTYTATSSGFVIINGGTVSLIEFARNASFIAVGLLAGMFPVGIGDQLRVTYAVVPTMTFIPR